MPKIAVFSRDGDFQREFLLKGFSLITGLRVLPDGELLVTGSQAGTDHILFRLDSIGTVKQGFLPLKRLTPTPRSPIPWDVARSFSVALRGDTALVVCTLSDSLWKVTLADGHVTAMAITVPGYIRPHAPEVKLNGPQDILKKWLSTFHTASAIYANGHVVVVPFVKGVLAYGDPATVAVLRGEKWEALTAAPPVLGISNERLVVLGHEQASDRPFLLLQPLVQR
ncbi:MAG: hypothetical protein IT361_05035 [Gemmatimonadaceae bacterium]|nr:hypothetical protein [Gemmatimonadaceae bacterium]